jgi:hypothetical protein
LEQKRRALSKTREIAQRKLAAAERELDRCGPLRRGRREQLRAEIELHRHALEVADLRLPEADASLEYARLQLRTVDRAEDGLLSGRVDEIRRVPREPRALSLDR